jgi:hypothetical protein
MPYSCQRWMILEYMLCFWRSIRWHQRQHYNFQLFFT